MSVTQPRLARVHTEAPRRPWLCVLVIVLAGVILAAYAGLIPMGTWRVDEYHDFGLWRQRGWSFFFERLLTWSPRPLSESIAGLYFLAEERTGWQLLGAFLTVMWASLLVGPALYVWRGRERAVATRLMIAAAVLCLFLLGHSVGEVFYWPMGSVAYATTLAALSALTFQTLDGHWERGRGRLFCVVCLLCAAGSAEVGAIFAIYFAGAMAVLHGAGWIGRRRDARLWLLPLGLGLIVMIFLALGRGALNETVFYRGVSPNPTYLHHPVASLLRTFPTYFRQLVVLDGDEMDGAAFAWGAAVKLLVCLGLLGALASARGAALPRGSRLVLGALVFSLQATVLTSIAGSYYKFGLVCCERHDTLRQCLFVLTALAGAALVGGLDLARSAGAALLGLALLVLLVRELPDLEGAYAAWPTAVRVRHANWDSGHAQGDRMTLLMMKLPPITHGMVEPDRATLRNDADTPWLWQLVMTFFGKQEIELKPIDG